MKYAVYSSLKKVFPDEDISSFKKPELVMLRNERLSFQVAFDPEGKSEISVHAEGELADNTSLYKVGLVPVGMPCYEDSDDFYLKKTPGLYPDVLYPLGGEFEITSEGVQTIWVEVNGNGQTAGYKTLTIKIDDTAINFRIKIIDAFLPENELIHTNWFHADCLCDYYGVEALSDEFWRICRNFISAAVHHGANCILTPLFTPPLDTAVGHERTTVQLVKVKIIGENAYEFDFSNLDKWVDMCLEEGVKYFEMSHFFTQWGAEHAPKIIALNESGEEKRIFGWDTPTDSEEYDSFLLSFASELNKYLLGKGIADKTFIHISDEPEEKHLAVYGKRAELIRKAFEGYPVLDALSNYEFYKLGSVDIPVPCENNIEQFNGKVPGLWTYYCCGQHSDYVPNRFIAMPSLRNRILGSLAYKYDLKGFLQWGYNFYNTQYSLESVDPFKSTDAGGKFPSGDSFVVYPAPDGTAYPSLRLKVFYEAIQDIGALKTLESKIGRDETLKLLGNITFKSYTHSDEEFLSVRSKIYNLIDES